MGDISVELELDIEENRRYTMKSFVPADYPRPQFVRENYTILNGEWDFAFDDEDAGLSQSWYRNFPAGKSITVPFSPEMGFCL